MRTKIYKMSLRKSFNFVTNDLLPKFLQSPKNAKKRSVRLCAWPWRDVARFAGPSIAEMFSNIGPANCILDTMTLSLICG